MKNIHVLVTDKPSRLHLGKSGLVLCDLVFNPTTINSQNIYITSDEEIKAGDWCYHIELKDDKIDRCYQVTKYHTWTNNGVDKTRKFKKIILTTDQDLIKDGVQSIDDEFLQWFVKNPSCESVEIQCRYNFYAGQDLTHYKIIIPQEEPRLINNCPKCGLDLVEREGSKPVCTRIDCGGIILSNETLREWALKEEPKQTDENGKPITYWGGLEEPKQETLEEAAEQFANDCTLVSEAAAYQAFIAGTKFQAERMYSEEEVKKIAEEVRWQAIGDPIEFTKNFNKWFSQFKKQNL